MAKETHSWSRLAEESQHEWELFEAYRNEYRNVTKLTRAMYPDSEENLEASRMYVYALEKKRNWKQRCLDYDRWIGQQKDDATAEMVRNEVKLIAKNRIQLLRSMHKKVKAVGDKIDQQLEADKNDLKETHIGAVSMYANVARVLLDEWRKIEDSNPNDATPERPFAAEVMGAQERLLEIIKKREKEPARSQVLQ